MKKHKGNKTLRNTFSWLMGTISGTTATIMGVTMMNIQIVNSMNSLCLTDQVLSQTIKDLEKL